MSSSIGVFGEGEIDGKPFRIYTFSSQTSSSCETAIDSGGDNDLSLQPLFLCPSTRRQAEWLKRKENGDYINDKIRLFNTSPHFPNKRSGVDPQVQHLLDNNEYICKLPLAPLFWCNNKCLKDNECSACENPRSGGTSYYWCVRCDEMFHKECVEAPLEIKHPSYPFLSLKLYTLPSDHLWGCISCEELIYGMIYHCPTYNLKMHPFCAMKPITTLIDHPKRHPHPLTFFPKQKSLACNVCGEIKKLIPTYVCARCVFVVHQDCIYFPYVIKIARHQHRISFTYSLPSGALSCGVCRKKVDNDYGAYSCNKCIGYFVHSRCALRRDLWDGEELEGVPEEPEIVVEPFETIADGIILHFSHGHNLKLEISRVYDEDKFCQACVLPIYEGSYYSCMDECDFILHEACANSPLKIHHPLYAHPLMLKVVTIEYDDNISQIGHFNCKACLRESCGFVYEDHTRGEGFRLDLRCASVSEPFEYQGHEHPLFLALSPQEEKSAICQICQDVGDASNYSKKLNCIECNFIICFMCATLPYKAMYKHDKHFLTFRKLKDGSDHLGWCELCERKIVYSRKRGFYTCDNNCCTTVHVHCLLGINMYMKPGQTIEIYEEKVHILRNSAMSRPFCHSRDCSEDRCPYRVFFEKGTKSFCSYYCSMD